MEENQEQVNQNTQNIKQSVLKKYKKFWITVSLVLFVVFVFIVVLKLLMAYVIPPPEPTNASPSKSPTNNTATKEVLKDERHTSQEIVWKKYYSPTHRIRLEYPSSITWTGKLTNINETKTYTGVIEEDENGIYIHLEDQGTTFSFYFINTNKDDFINFETLPRCTAVGSAEQALPCGEGSPYPVTNDVKIGKKMEVTTCDTCGSEVIQLNDNDSSRTIEIWIQNEGHFTGPYYTVLEALDYINF